MKISIVIPLYNSEEYVIRCLASVAEQTSQCTIECIVVNDCSKDGSMQRVRDYLDTYTGNVDFQVICHEKNFGVAAARNTGLKYASGDYVMFLDSDDFLMPDSISSMVKPLYEYAFDLVMAGYLDDEGEVHEVPLEGGPHWSNNVLLDYYSSPKCVFTVWNKLYSQALLQKISARFDESLTVWEDVLWSIQLTCLLENFYVIRSSLYHYTFNGTSLTHSLPDGKLLNAKVYSSEVIREYILNESRIDARHSLALVRKMANDLLEELNCVADCNATARLFKKVVFDNSSHIKKNYKLMSVRQRIRDFYYLLPYPLSLFYWKTIIVIGFWLERIR